MQWLFTGWVVTVSHWLNPCQSRRANISSSVGICYHYRPWELPLLAFQFYLNWSFITFYKNNNTKRSEDKEKQYPRHCWSECKLAQPLWNTLGSFLQNPTHTITKPSICTLGYYLWETKTYLHTNTAQEGDKLKVAEQKDMYSSFLQFSCSVASNSLWPNGLQHARLPCPSPSPGIAQTHVHRVGDAIQPTHPLSSPSSPAFNLSQHRVFSFLFFWKSLQAVLLFSSKIKITIKKEYISLHQLGS